MKFISLRLLTLTLTLTLTCMADAQAFDLQRALQMTEDSTLSVYVSEHQKECEEEAYKEFFALRKPQLKFSAYQDNYFVQQRLDKKYVSNSNYKYLSWGGGLELSQQLLSFGGEMYARSQFVQTYDFGLSDANRAQGIKPFYQAYSPISVGYRNALLGYNRHEWDRRIIEAKLQYARKAATHELYVAYEETVRMYMNLLTAQSAVTVCRRNFLATDSLYQIGKEKYSIAFITQGNLMSLEVARMNASNALDAAMTDEHTAAVKLASWLHCPISLLAELSLPDYTKLKNMSLDEALLLAENNNPKMLQLQQQIIQAQSEVERARRQSKLTADVDVSLGYNVVRGSDNLNNFGFVGGIGVSIPLIDHGAAQHRLRSASQRVEEQETAIRECKRSIKGDVETTIVTISDKRILLDKVEKAFRLSESLFNLNVENYSQGIIDLNTFLASQRHRDEAYQHYISAISEYWQACAHLATLTLTDMQVISE